MAQAPAVHFPGQQREEGLEVFRLERLGRHELPDDGAELVAQFGNAAVNKPGNRVARARQHPAVGGIAARLQREQKSVRRLAVPLGKGRRLEGAVVGAVDLDSAEPAAGVVQLFAVRQTRRIEVVAPGLEGPAADADADVLVGAGGGVHGGLFGESTGWPL